MKHIATVARKLNPGVAGACAQQTPVTMTFSGTGAPSAVNLKQPNTTVALLRLWKTALAAVNVGLRPAPVPGQAIADTVRVGLAVFTFEILKSDGTPIGTIVTNGFAGGSAPPGSPLTATAGANFVIAGGTGAFLGARGQMEMVAKPAGSGLPTGSLHYRGPREPPPQWRWNTTVCSPFNPIGEPRNCDATCRPGHHPFQRLLSRHCVQAGGGRRDPVGICAGSRPGEPGS